MFISKRFKIMEVIKIACRRKMTVNFIGKQILRNLTKKMLRIKKMEELKLFENLKVRKVFGNKVRKLLLK